VIVKAVIRENTILMSDPYRYKLVNIARKAILFQRHLPVALLVQMDNINHKMLPLVYLALLGQLAQVGTMGQYLHHWPTESV
jgi:hypothetical protein